MAPALAALLVVLGAAAPNSGRAQDAPAFAFVRTLIDSLAGAEKNRERLDADRTPIDPETASACARDGAALAGEARLQAQAVRAVDADAALRADQSQLAGLYEQEAGLADAYVAACRALSQGAQGNPEFGRISTGLVETTQRLDQVERRIYQTTLAVTADLRAEPPRNGLGSEQKTLLLRKLQQNFGDALDVGDRGFLVDSAAVLQMYLAGPVSVLAQGS